MRAATRTLHDRTEAVVGLPGSVRTLEDYRRVLAQFWGFHAGYEAPIARCDLGGSRMGAGRLDRAARAAADLRALGVAEGAVARLPKAEPGAFAGPAEALGALYVLEGSRLGGEVIRRDLEARLGAEVAGAVTFFGGPAPSWRGFVQALNRELADEARLERAERAAATTFEAFIGWFQA